MYLTRLDLSPDSPVYERMRDALDYLGDDPSVYEMDELNSHWKERVLCGTSLRDVILRSFLRPGPISVETHNPQNTHGRESGSQSSTNEHMRGVFRNDMRIMSWARRYSKEKPVIVEGDPDLGALNSSQLRAIAMMVGERVSLIQGVSASRFYQPGGLISFVQSSHLGRVKHEQLSKL